MLANEVTGLIDTSCEIVACLKVKLLEAAAIIKAANLGSCASTPTEMSSPGALNETFQAQIAKEIANLKIGIETKSTSKSINDFGFSDSHSQFPREHQRIY